MCNSFHLTPREAKGSLEINTARGEITTILGKHLNSCLERKVGEDEAQPAMAGLKQGRGM